MHSWRAFWAEAWRPSGPDETPYQWAAVAAGHTLIGLAAAVSLGWLLHPVLAPGLIVLAYAVLKERRDARHGGRRRDGLIDAGFVGLGAAAAGAPLLVPVALGLIALGVTFHARIR